ncbi:hypothetical protein CK203_036810 [Vitis vinifera]|uniref:Uncharacterized protein n=1 Tax=Vitis vinifera TaxID=29760 RepID=A0A438I0K6_VITVI|nr:hypothetical protein CK203_036810 [Vitis vinifera]
MLVIRMYCGADVFMEAVGCLCFVSVVCSSLRQSGYKGAHVCFIGRPDEGDPDDNACHVSLFRFNLGLKNVFKEESCFICRELDAHEKSTDKLSDVVSTEKAEQDTVIFSKEQFNAGLRFPLPALFKEFLHFTKIPPVFIHPNIIRVLMGCSIINMLYNLDLTLLEVFFVYSLKKAKTDIFSMSAPALPSIGDGTARLDEGRGEGTRDGPGCMGGVEHPARPFSPNYSLVIPGPEKEGHLVDWVEKASFACLSKLFEIDAKERHYKTLLTARNLMAVVREPKSMSLKRLTLKNAEHSWIIGRREKRRNPSEGSRTETRRSLSSNKAPAKKRKLVKNGKGVKEPTPPKEFAPPPITHEAEVIIEEPVNLPPHSISSGSGHVAGLNHSEAVCATPMEEAGAESQSQPSDDPDRLALVLVKGPPSKRPRSARNLRSGLIGRLQDRQQEIEVSCSSAYDAHPEGGEVEMATETPAVPVMVPDEVAPGETHPPFSYAELEDKLKQIPPGLTTMPSAKMFEMVESLVSGLRGMANQYDLFTDLLRTTDYMKAFAARHKDTEDQLRLRLGRLKPAYPPLGGE